MMGGTTQSDRNEGTRYGEDGNEVNDTLGDAEEPAGDTHLNTPHKWRSTEFEYGWMA